MDKTFKKDGLTVRMDARTIKKFEDAMKTPFNDTEFGYYLSRARDEDGFSEENAAQTIERLIDSDAADLVYVKPGELYAGLSGKSGR